MSIALDAARWIVDTLLHRRQENFIKKKEKWIQVSKFLDETAVRIAGIIDDFKSQKFQTFVTLNF